MNLQRFGVAGEGAGILGVALKRLDEFLPWQASSMLLPPPTSNTKQIFPSVLLVHGAAASQVSSELLNPYNLQAYSNVPLASPGALDWAESGTSSLYLNALEH